VGDGPMEAAVRERAARMPAHVSYAGRLEGAALEAVYADHDVLVAPSSREVWGLVVNEGLARGLWVIATDEVASAADLLMHQNGRIVRAANVQDLAAAIVEAPAGLARTSRCQRATSVSHCTSQAFATTIGRAIDRAWSAGVGVP